MRAAPAAALLFAAAVQQAAAQHACDPVTDEGWRVLASIEVAGIRDGAPVQVGADWVVERVTTLLPLCNYFNAAGTYSMRSYSLAPFERAERVTICRAGRAVAPYAGKCPPN